MKTFAIARLTTANVDLDGLHNLTVCSSKFIVFVEFLVDDIRRVISSTIMAMDMNVGNVRTQSFFFSWK